MNEFVEKLIERLEEKKENLFKLSQSFPYSRDREYGIEEAISIVKELSEEYAKDINVRTNADRIRSMTDEELAEFFETVFDCMNCPQKGCIIANDRGCQINLLEWLQAEVEE